MKRSIIIASIVTAVLAVSTLSRAALTTEGSGSARAPRVGPEQALLKMFEGEWDAVTTGMGDPTKGKQSTKLGCDGMWLFTTYQGEYMGQAFEGRGVMGYDQEAKKYQNLWVDSMTPKMAVEEGTWDEKSKTMTFDSKGPDGSPAKMTFVFTDADHYTLRFLGTGPDGKEGEMFKIVYTRQAAKPTPK